jgi:uncharacterized protein YjbI with pentapeptide repeats
MTKNWTIVIAALVAELLAVLAPAYVARADIFEWEYINPADPDLGKQPSTALAPDGAGAIAAPGTNLSSRILTKAYLIGADLSWYTVYFEDGYPKEHVFANLTSANLSQADLTDALVGGARLNNANLSQANLTNADFSGHYDRFGYYSPRGADLTGVILTGAEVRGANFARDDYYPGSGVTLTQLYSTASYQAHDLSGIGLSGNDLTSANLSNQNLTNATFNRATLTGANLSGAEVRAAKFSNYQGTGITKAQLYSTASYQAHDLGAIGLGGAELVGANLAGHNLAGASFSGYFYAVETGGETIPGANLTGADLSGADARGADFYAATLAGANLSRANLQNASFSGDPFGDAYTNLANANLRGANARGANFALASLSGANFTDAKVQGAAFAHSSLTAAQIYSTASYKDHDLSGIRFWGIDLAGANFAGQNLTNANFYYARLSGANLSQANLTNANFSTLNNVSSDLTGANLSHANLTNANFNGYAGCGDEGCGIAPGANLTNANLSSADSRGARFDYATLAGADTSNLIRANGHIAGLSLTSGKSLVVRDYDGNSTLQSGPLPIVVEQHLAMDAGTLRLAFDADPWDSTIAFAPGVSAVRGGTLDLTFGPGVDVAAQSGRTIDLFDWTGASPTGAFAITSPYSWDLTKLYTTGEVTLLPTADFNRDDRVDGGDLAAWSGNFGLPAGSANSQGNADYDGDVDGGDFLAWQRQLGSPAPAVAANAPVPEPATSLLLILTAAGMRSIGGRMRQ